MAISVLKSHVFRKQNSLELLWPQPLLLPYKNGGFQRRQFSRPAFLLLPHRRPLLPRSVPFRHSLRLPTAAFPPLLRRRLLPLCSAMSSLSSSAPDGDKSASATAAAKTVRVVVKGRVQGVFYRNWTVDNAKGLGLKGWVRNRRDGSVEALFSGIPDKVQEMEQRCRRGPPDAMVTGFQVFPCSDDPGTTFERKPTV